MALANVVIKRVKGWSGLPRGPIGPVGAGVGSSGVSQGEIPGIFPAGLAFWWEARWANYCIKEGIPGRLE